MKQTGLPPQRQRCLDYLRGLPEGEYVDRVQVAAALNTTMRAAGNLLNKLLLDGLVTLREKTAYERDIDRAAFRDGGEHVWRALSACPVCGALARTAREEIAHMEAEHRDVIDERLRQAGFRKVGEEWVDTLAGDDS